MTTTEEADSRESERFEPTGRRKSPVDLHIRCGCGGVFSLELDQQAWSLWGQYLVETGKAWIGAHAHCQKQTRTPEPSALPESEGA